MATKTYDEYDKEFELLLSKVRRNLASTRSKTALLESERLLNEARRAAMGMVGLAEIEGSPDKIRTAQIRMEREIRPLQQEISSTLKLFGNVGYQAPSTDLEEGAFMQPPAFLTTPRTSMDTQQLIAYSDELLQESQALCDASEQIGNNTLQRMSSQREQLQTASRSLDRTTELTMHAKQLLVDMRNKGLRHKLVLYTLIALLVGANGYAIYWLFTKK